LNFLLDSIPFACALLVAMPVCMEIGFRTG